MRREERVSAFGVRVMFGLRKDLRTCLRQNATTSGP